MTKYFVESGTLRTIVRADSSRNAALWAVHQAMQQVLPIDDDDRSDPFAKSEKAVSGGVNVLEETLRVSATGFGRTDAQTVITMDVVRQWNDMFAALDRLEKMLDHGGLAA